MEYEYKDLQILKQYRESNLVRTIFIVSIIMVIVLFSLFVITVGPLEITVFDTYKVILSKLLPSLVSSPSESIASVIWLVRVPRVLTAIIVGFSLAVAGAVIQPVLRNSMASPFTLGLSSGAGFGAALAIILGKSIGFGTYYIIANAFFFSLMTSAIILIISRLKEITPEMMILMGIAISHLFSAGITMLQYFADSLLVSEVLFWMVGSLSKGTWETLKIMFPIVFIGVILLIVKSKDLNYISVLEKMKLKV